jgi:hypothetical protein
MKILKKFNEYNEMNEKIFQDQYDFNLNLKPGDVIYAKEDISVNAVDFAKMSKSKIGKISKLNLYNMWTKDGWGSKYNEYAGLNGKKDDVLAVVLSNGQVIFKNEQSCNIKDGKDDTILKAYNILLQENKIGIRDYNINNNEERKMVFEKNLNWGASKWFSKNSSKWVQYIDIEFDSSENSYNYDFNSDTLIITDAYDIKTGKGNKKQRIHRASKNPDITRDGKHLNKI